MLLDRIIRISGPRREEEAIITSTVWREVPTMPLSPAPDAAYEGRSSILEATTLDTPDFRWLGLKKLTWQDPKGVSRVWECVYRTTRRSECDGVAAVVFVRYPVSGKEDEVVLVSQYRPPVAAEVIESPAGLVDEGEDARAAAERELLEETGFSGEVTHVSPIVPCDPGVTDTNMRFVTVEVDGDSEENRNPVARPEEGEFLTLRRLPAASMQESLDALANGGLQVDARLYAMALGYTLGKKSVVSTNGAGFCGKWSNKRWLGGVMVVSCVVTAAALVTMASVRGISLKGR